MTVKELNQLHWLRREIERDTERLEALKDKAESPTSPSYSGMRVQGGDNESTLERLCIEIADLETIISEKRIRCIQERVKLERYIAGIDDSLTRLVFTARFVDGLTWDETAATVGDKNTGDGVRMMVYRYMRRHEGRTQ